VVFHAIIIEDDPMVAQINRQYLERFNKFIIEGVFNNGRKALDYLRNNPNDLIILDVYMPSMTGIQFLRELRSEQIESAVIMVTAATETQVVSDSLKLGILDYLIKPFSFERFQRAIHIYLNKAELLKSNSIVDQNVVDRLINNDFETAELHMELSKGLNYKTLETIYGYLQEHQQEKLTCEKLSYASCLSKVTIRRYLNYLIDTGKVQSCIDYETGGRPRVLYYLNQ
jgi:response regulator of citrate/malate metabolism